MVCIAALLEVNITDHAQFYTSLALLIQLEIFPRINEIAVATAFVQLIEQDKAVGFCHYFFVAGGFCAVSLEVFSGYVPDAIAWFDRVEFFHS